MEKTPHILIVDDDREIRYLLSRFLQKHGFRASTAADGRDMRKVLADPTAEEYAWSPDGRRVAYHSRQSGEWGVWLMLDR